MRIKAILLITMSLLFTCGFSEDYYDKNKGYFVSGALANEYYGYQENSFTLALNEINDKEKIIFYSGKLKDGVDGSITLKYRFHEGGVYEKFSVRNDGNNHSLIPDMLVLNGEPLKGVAWKNSFFYDGVSVNSNTMIVDVTDTSFTILTSAALPKERSFSEIKTYEKDVGLLNCYGVITNKNGTIYKEYSFNM